MIRIFSILLSFFASSVCFSQLPEKLGKGIITIDQYFLQSDTAGIIGRPSFCSYTYYIDDSVVLRRDSSDISWIGSSADTDQVKISLSIKHPSYLIDWKTKLLYTPYKKNDSQFVAKDSLKKFQYEYFFRFPYAASAKRKFLYSDSTDNQIIGGHNSIAGYALFDDHHVKFYYTIDSLKLHSPLNFLLPGFPYSILSIRLRNSDPRNPVCEFVVRSLFCKDLSSDLFNLPLNAPVKTNVPIDDILDSIGNTN